jgi:hypothetical protein
MNTQIDNQESSNIGSTQSCSKKFESEAGIIENSYVCNQPRFTGVDLWNLKKHKREFARPEQIIVHPDY